MASPAVEMAAADGGALEASSYKVALEAALEEVARLKVQLRAATEQAPLVGRLLQSPGSRSDDGRADELKSRSFQMTGDRRDQASWVKLAQVESVAPSTLCTSLPCAIGQSPIWSLTHSRFVGPIESPTCRCCPRTAHTCAAQASPTKISPNQLSQWRCPTRELRACARQAVWRRACVSVWGGPARCVCACACARAPACVGEAERRLSVPVRVGHRFATRW